MAVEKRVCQKKKPISRPQAKAKSFSSKYMYNLVAKRIKKHDCDAGMRVFAIRKTDDGRERERGAYERERESVFDSQRDRENNALNKND